MMPQRLLNSSFKNFGNALSTSSVATLASISLRVVFPAHAVLTT